MSGTKEGRMAVNSALRAIPRLLEASALGVTDRALDLGEEIAKLLEDEVPSVSERIRKMRAQRRGLSTASVQVPADLLELYSGETDLASVVLPETVLSSAREIVDEMANRDRLAEFHADARNKIILHGPPGNGKTMLARAMGREIGLPVFEVRYGNLIASYLGETGRNLERVFDFAGAVPCVLFIDEFDTIGLARAGSNDVGESRRITNQVLLLLDRLPPTCVVFAATNLFDLIDPALARRFDFDILVPSPTPEIARRCAEVELSPDKTPGYDYSDWAEAIAGAGLPHLSAVVQFCRRLRRDLCLHGGANAETMLAGLYARLTPAENRE